MNWSDRKDACGGSTLGLCLIKASKRSSMFTASQALPKGAKMRPGWVCRWSQGVVTGQSWYTEPLSEMGIGICWSPGGERHSQQRHVCEQRFGG